MKRVAATRELLDGPLQTDLLAGNLRDLARINRWLGGAALSFRAIDRFAHRERDGVLTVLDVGTGAADIPIDLARRSAQRNRHVSITATDIRPEVIELARRSIADRAISVRVGTIEGEADRSFDVVHASLVLHHLEPTQALSFLNNMRRVARLGVVINDLDRGRVSLAAAWLLTRVATRNPYTRHDAPLSVRRAYRPNEVVQMARRAGLAIVARYDARPAHRYALVFVPENPTDG